jgi:hypothetical protein
VLPFDVNARELVAVGTGLVRSVILVRNSILEALVAHLRLDAVIEPADWIGKRYDLLL